MSIKKSHNITRKEVSYNMLEIKVEIRKLNYCQVTLKVLFLSVMKRMSIHDDSFGV